jgi:putative Holliday junction resolvase
MRILAIDYGTARTGLAVSDPSGILASPLCVIKVKNMKQTAEAVKEKIDELKIEKIIMGCPIRTDGKDKDSEMKKKVEAFAEILFNKTGLKAELVNEVYTTVIASQKLHENEKNAKQQRANIDSVAASILLQDYLDKK